MFFIDAAKFTSFGYNGCRFSACSSVCFCASYAWNQLLSWIKDFFAKTLNDVRFDFSWKVITSPKSTFPNICHTIRNIDAGEWTAIRKSIISNICHTIRNIYISEWFTPRVSIISWLSVLYALNGRKVTVWILFRYEKVII